MHIWFHSMSQPRTISCLAGHGQMGSGINNTYTNIIHRQQRVKKHSPEPDHGWFKSVDNSKMVSIFWMHESYRYQASECCAVNTKHASMSYYHCDMTVMAVLSGRWSLVRNCSVRNKILQEETRPDVKWHPSPSLDLDMDTGREKLQHIKHNWNNI